MPLALSLSAIWSATNINSGSGFGMEYNHYLDRSQFRWQWQRPSSSLWVMISPPISRVRHTPRCCPRILPGFVRWGILLQRLLQNSVPKVGCSCLQCFSILHHGFDGIGIICTSKTFISVLLPFITGIAIHSSANLAWTSCIICASWMASCLVACAVCPSCHKTLLFSKWTGTHLPPNHIGPLVDQDGQISIRLYPSLCRYSKWWLHLLDEPLILPRVWPPDLPSIFLYCSRRLSKR